MVNREIKFRAWDTSKQKMYSAYEMGQDELQINPDGRGFFNASSISPKLSEYYPHMTPMQYTGLKDKNGKEIYEGDVVIIEDTYKDRILDDGSGPIEPFNHLAPVVFEYAEFGVKVNISADIFFTGFWSFTSIEKETGQSEFEVIGNIYENPDLLANSHEGEGK